MRGSAWLERNQVGVFLCRAREQFGDAWHLLHSSPLCLCTAKKKGWLGAPSMMLSSRDGFALQCSLKLCCGSADLFSSFGTRGWSASLFFCTAPGQHFCTIREGTTPVLEAQRTEPASVSGNEKAGKATRIKERPEALFQEKKTSKPSNADHVKDKSRHSN